MPKHSRSDYHGAFFLYYTSRRFFAWTWVSQSNVSTCFCFCWGAQKDREREMGLESPSSGFFYMVSHRFFVVAHLAVALLEAALMHHICLGLSSGGKKCSNSSILWQNLLCVCCSFAIRALFCKSVSKAFSDMLLLPGNRPYIFVSSSLIVQFSARMASLKSKGFIEGWVI